MLFIAARRLSFKQHIALYVVNFNNFSFIFSERELMLSPVPPSVVCLSSVTFVRPTQPAEIFGNVSTH